ncbi:exodeoxyribonuclease III [Pelagibius sp.]|uniref:exodeoxyribonuclease III n=1 Tax=Pelagibius sp. TaxID=1931238 RepID=UPI0026298C49|nr:exodeoxyribonuclease III [Pelagibius sp.]
MTSIASWNVNSIKARLPNILSWLETASPDVALLQELKTVEENFPRLEIEALGYNCAVLGQKSYNGVAILSKAPLEDVLEGLPGDPDDEQARYLEATTFGLRVACIYLPNGNPIKTEKFPYKIAWMDRLRAHARGLLDSEQPVVLGGDYNVIPQDEDVYDPKAFAGDALTQPESRQRFRALVNEGYTEAFRALHDEPHQYTFWDYQGGGWQNDHGLRIDHFLLSPQAADRLESCEIDRGPRGEKKASDHTPIVCRLREAA